MPVDNHVARCIFSQSNHFEKVTWRPWAVKGYYAAKTFQHRAQKLTSTGKLHNGDGKKMDVKFYFDWPEHLVIFQA